MNIIIPHFDSTPGFVKVLYSPVTTLRKLESNTIFRGKCRADRRAPCHLPPSLGTAGPRRIAPARTTLGTARSSRKKEKKRRTQNCELLGSR